MSILSNSVKGWVNIDSVWASFLEIDSGTYECDVLGLMQDNNEDTNSTQPVFVVALKNGLILTPYVTCVKLKRSTDQIEPIIEEIDMDET